MSAGNKVKYTKTRLLLLPLKQTNKQTSRTESPSMWKISVKLQLSNVWLETVSLNQSWDYL